MRIYIIMVAALLLFTTSCRDSGLDSGDGAAVAPIVRIDSVLEEIPLLSTDGRDSVMDCWRRPMEMLAGILPGDGSTDDVIADFASSRGFKAFVAPVHDRIMSLDSVERVLGQVSCRLPEYLPGVSLGELYGVILPYKQAVVQSDSIVMIALNHYLGSDFDGYGYFEPYQRVNKRIGQLPYDVVEARIAYSRPMEPKADGSAANLLNVMLYQGALIKAKMEIVPDATLADALGYTPEQLQWAEANEARVWDAIVTKRLLYSTAYMDIERLIAPSPAVSVIHPDAPGSIGRYIGYKIVDSYMRNNPSVSLDQVLSSDVYNNSSVLINACYAPR